MANLINEKLNEMQNGSSILSEKEHMLQRFADLDRENEQWVNACSSMGWILDIVYTPIEGRGYTHKLYAQMLFEDGQTEEEILSLLGSDIDSKEWQDVTVKIVETLKLKYTEPDFEWFKYNDCGKDEAVWHAGDVTILGLIKK
jgi:hypothetical protein